MIPEPDILVVGAGLGGVAAALAACRAGRTVVLTEETDWIGGQLTSQAVPPDEHPWVEQFGTTASYRRLREGIRAYYRQWYPMRSEALALTDLNPGAGRVSKLCHEPRVALTVLEAMLAPHRAAGRLTLLTEHRAVAAEADNDVIRAVTLENLRTGDRDTVTARYVIDATETGELLELGGVEHAIGAEARGEFDEPHAPEEAQPLNQQGITVCFALSHHEGENHTVDRPADYDFWRSYRPDFWPGPLLGFQAPDPRSLESVPRTFVPNPDIDPLAVSADQSADAGDKELWGFRRILARGMHRPGAFGSDITLVNWPLNDYWLKPLIGAGEEVSAQAVAEARQLSLSLLYWLQTEAPARTAAPDSPVFGSAPTSPAPRTASPRPRTYASPAASRPSPPSPSTTCRSTSSARTAEHGTGTRSASAATASICTPPPEVTTTSTSARSRSRSRSVPSYRAASAICCPCGKNIGTTHITNGCYRLHPVEWNIGEVAGALAAHCLTEGVEPRQVQSEDKRYEAFARLLDRDGVQRHWPDVRGY